MKYFLLNVNSLKYFSTLLSYDDNIACALVPPKPKLLTAPYITSFFIIIFSSYIITLSFIFSNIYGLILWQFIFFGMILLFNSNTSLINPAIPAPPSKWPIFCFTDPKYNFSQFLPYVFINAPISIGSPNFVPVPWHSTMSIFFILDFLITSLINISWDGPFGAVNELVLPSWLIPVPLISAYIYSLSLISDVFFNITAPHPSPLTYPFADSSNVLHFPSKAIIFILLNDSKILSSINAFTPVTKAILISLFNKCLHAISKATNEDEQAVSIAILGPLISKIYDILFADIECVHPVIE